MANRKKLKAGNWAGVCPRCETRIKAGTWVVAVHGGLMWRHLTCSKKPAMSYVYQPDNQIDVGGRA